MAKKRPLPQVLNDQESEALRAAARNVRDRCALSLLEDLGLRASECAAVRLEDLDWHSQTLRVHGKGGREAQLPIPARARGAIEEALKHRPATTTHGHLLWNLRDPAAGPVSRIALWRLVRRLGRQALGRPLWPHLLRHTLGSRLYRHHADLAVVQKALRHVNPSTSSIYISISTDQQRAQLEAIDSRPRWARWWGSLKPSIVPDVLKPKRQPLAIGETIGRAQELSQLRANLRQRVHCLLVGEQGSGRRHLLAHVSGERAYHLERFTPLREVLVELCEQLKQDGLLAELPKGRSSRPFVQALAGLGKTAEFTLVVGGLDGLTKQEARALETLSKHWLLFAAVSPEDKGLVERRVFFGRAHAIVEVPNLEKREALELARRAMVGLAVGDESSYLNHVWAQSNGNPGALLAMVEQTRKTGNLAPEHRGRRVLSATPVLAAIWTAVVLSRYTASALSNPSWKVWATIIVFGLLPFLLLDRLLAMRRRTR